MPISIQEFLEIAPHGAARALQILATAESLTDDTARQLYDLAPVPGLTAELFIHALHYADFVAPRNSEWYFSSTARGELQGLHAADTVTVTEAHRLLATLATEGDRALAGSRIPAYLFTPAGKAYHLAGTGDLQQALSLYGRATSGPLTGAQWLAARLASEQEELGVLPRGNIETLFLRAMVLVREGNREGAEPLLRLICASKEVRIEVGIACHLLGLLVARQRDAAHQREAEQLYRRSIEILEELGNRFGVAQTLHSLANLLARDRNPDRQREAEQLYRRSIEIGEETGNRFHVAQALHSLANLLARDRNPDRQREAEQLYRRSIEIGEETGNRFHVAQALHSLANLLARDRNPDRHKEAEQLYRRSIEIGEETGNRFHVAQALHSLANLLARDRNPDRQREAEQLYRRSIEIGEQLGNRHHLAQTLRSFALLIEHRSSAEAEQLLQRSLDLNRQANDRRGERIVLDSLRRLRERYPRH